MSRYFGPIMQNGYVVRDWRRAAEHWVETLGVGPFFVMEHIAFVESTYRGRASAIDVTVAIAYSGEHQVELVQQHNDAPSVYRDFLDASPEGLQHVGALVPDLEAAIAARDWQDRVVQRAVTAAGMRAAYVDTVSHGGTMIELIETNEAMLSAFAYMKRTAQEWDGERPIRISK